VNDKQDHSSRQVFRSPSAIVVWWVWLLFAVGNLIDLAVQGRDHLSLVAAFILLFVTGIVYVTAQRPRIVADADALTIANPIRDHRVDWAAVAGADPTDLLRVRCEWPDGDRTRQRIIYSWAVHSSRRRQIAAELRAQRQARRGARGGSGGAGIFGSGAGGYGFGGGSGGMLGMGGSFGGSSADPAPEGDPLRLDPDKIVATITERAGQARLDAPEERAAAPASTWDWVAVAAVVVPGLALLIVALV
jgi:Bacterial PH domain